MYTWNIPTLVLTIQRTLVVDFEGGTSRVAELFVECLTALPNLHTLEISSMWEDQIAQSFTTALRERKPKLQLQQVQTLILPPKAHQLLRYCPNVEDLTCCTMKPDIGFVESLAVGGPVRIAKFSVLCLEGKDTRSMKDIWSGMVYFVSPLPSMGQTYVSSDRDC